MVQQINKVIYHDSSKKILARQAIIDVYKQLFKQQTLPASKQFWSLCSNNAENGILLPGSELKQLLDINFITPTQYHGVDFDQNIITANQTYVQANWHCGDIYTVIAAAQHLNPGFINLDLIWMKDKGTLVLSKILSLLTELNITNIFVAANVVIKQRYQQNTPEQLITTLTTNQIFRLCQHHWILYDKIYVYQGSNKASTNMGTIILYNLGICT